MNPALPLSPQVFTILSALIEERLGLFFGPDYRELVADKLSARVRERGFESMLDYYYFLRYDPDGPSELLAAADLLTVNETYFLREAAQLHVLADDIIAARAAAGQRTRVWCAACSTGEEPISLASLLDGRGLLDRVELLASDVSARALRIASRGAYGSRAVRALESLPAWLTKQGEEHVASARLREAITWRRVNLMDQDAVQALGTFDVIVCRNVLIYFRDDTTRQVVERLFGALAPNGHLLVGASESLLRLGTAFVCEERRGSFFYRRGPE